MPVSPDTSQLSLRPDEVAIAQYRTVSKIALLALGLGVASALALANLLFVPIALAAIATAVIALRSISASGGELIGRSLAVAGLCLATLFLGWSVGWSVSRQQTLAAQGREVAEAWLTMIADGKIRHAHQLTLGMNRRAENESAMERLYATEPDATTDLNKWFAEQPLKSFTALGKNVEFRFESVAATAQEQFTEYVILKFTFNSKQEPSKTTAMFINVQRTPGAESFGPEWKIAHVAGSRP